MIQKKERINFLPRELRPSLINHRTFACLLALAVLGMPALSGIVGVWKWQVDQQRITAQNLQDRIAADLEARISLRAENQDARSLASVQTVIDQKIYWSAVLKELTNVTPPTLWLNEFETKAAEGGRMVLISGSAGSQKQVAEFLSNMENSYFFRNVQMKFAESQENLLPRTFKFQFEGTIFDPPGGTPHAED